ncbi:putative chaperone/heat shock protein Hsp12 [Ascobolus immersus RN42]|uniref:Putative chaperone/heat shock protein Hsp12 n=1 Tax=Ascobolus immersus RN42 TaxID=1160509 RepID=A0A3N4HSV9_ASCIM|nr:putative chaperone/heat shock protein Hsp12 [Ascobolus immersus RN42]
MTDFGRKDFSTQAKEKMTPDSSKSAAQRTKESVTDIGDRVAADLKPDSSKSGTQEVFDKGRRSKDTHTDGGKAGTIGDKIKHAVGL